MRSPHVSGTVGAVIALGREGGLGMGRWEVERLEWEWEWSSVQLWTSWKRRESERRERLGDAFIGMIDPVLTRNRAGREEDRLHSRPAKIYI